jgi:hypothetical protein
VAGLENRTVHVAEQGADFGAESFCPLRQFAHFVGNHCEAAPRLAGAGCFDGGIECEQFGLPVDVVDLPDQPAHLVELRADTIEAFGDLTAARAQGFCRCDEVAQRNVGALREVLHFAAPARLFLIGGQHHQLFGHGAQLCLTGGFPHVRRSARNDALGLFQRALQAFELLLTAVGERRAQVVVLAYVHVDFTHARRLARRMEGARPAAENLRHD